MADNTVPHGAHLGPLFPPAYHRPWLRYADAVDGAEAGNGEPAGAAGAAGDAPQGNAAADKVEVDWKAESRKHEARAKANLARAEANEDAARRLKEIEDANKTESQKASDRIAQLEAENKTYKQREQETAWRDEVSEATGVPASVLRGSTLEEIQEHAESLKSVLTPEPGPKKDGPVSTIGQEPRNPGAVPLRDQIAAAEKAGDRELVSALKAIQLGNPS
ncbi:hypothetical protein [Microbacterium sp.]|uniref:hypothetical protein n=1 Tax=Microbacterium sp. TaxID=51671 RepID=UPI003A92C4C5